MPVYEYYCDRCQHGYEFIRSASRRDEPAPCPKCGVSGQRKLSTFVARDGRYGHFFKGVAPLPRPADKSEDQGRPAKP